MLIKWSPGDSFLRTCQYSGFFNIIFRYKTGFEPISVSFFLLILTEFPFILWKSSCVISRICCCYVDFILTGKSHENVPVVVGIRAYMDYQRQHGNVFRITGPLWWESIGDRWVPITKSQYGGTSVVSLLWDWTSCGSISWFAGDLSRREVIPL